MTEKTVTFGYGLAVGTLEEQANRQGYTLGEKADFFEKLRHARTMLMFHVLTESQEKSITMKIHEKVMEAIVPLEDQEDSA